MSVLWKKDNDAFTGTLTGISMAAFPFPIRNLANRELLPKYGRIASLIRGSEAVITATSPLPRQGRTAGSL